jgi:hypothetical protein
MYTLAGIDLTTLNSADSDDTIRPRRHPGANPTIVSYNATTNYTEYYPELH